MGCKTDINVDGTPALKSIQTYCGTNKKLLVQIVNAVGEPTDVYGVYKPSDIFIDYYKEKYKKEPSFNEGNLEQLKEDIIECYKRSVPSIKDSVRDEGKKDVISIYGYSSASARNDGKLVVSSAILRAHRDSLFKFDPNSDEGRRDALARGNLIARGIVNNSELTSEEKKALINAINKCRDVSQIRKLLADKNLKSNFNVYGKNVEYYKYLAKNILKKELINRIAFQSGEDAATIVQKLVRIEVENGERKEIPNVEYINEALGGKNMSAQDKDLVATFVEINMDTKEYFDELMLNSKLDFLRNDRSDELDDENEKLAVDAVSEEGEEGNLENETPTNDDVDLTIGLYDHSGTYTSAMTHVNKDIKALLDSIPLLASDQLVKGKPDYDYDNALGMIVTMDANKAATVLYHYLNTNNVNDMIKSIRDIAASLPGFAGFSQLADMMESDKTIAFAFYTNFGKKVVNKVQAQQEGGNRSLVITNQRSNRLDALRQELFNSMRTALPKQDYLYNTELYENLDKYLTDNAHRIKNNPDSQFCKGATERIVKILKHYYPTLDDFAIQNYITKHRNENGVLDIASNLSNLKEIIRRTVKESIKSQAKYNEMLDSMRDIRKQNKANDDKRKNLRDQGLPTKSVPENKDPYVMYVKDYMTQEQKDVAKDLSTLLVDYALIKVENNSLNPLGNQSSDVINSSFITGMMQILQDRVLLGKYGDFKFQSQQYNFSNILMEHVDDDHNIIYGLFRRTNNGVVPTEYALDLLKVALYGGARNFDDERGITYPMHSKGDYLASEFTAFFNSGMKPTKHIKEFAGYFMRTPSDAPKNFMIYAPKYSASNLFVVTNKKERDARIQEIKDAVNKKVFTGDEKDFGVNKTAITVKRRDSFANHVLKSGNTILLPDWATKNRINGQEYTFKFRYVPEDEIEDGQNIYLVKGTLKDGMLVNTEFAGTFNNSYSVDARMALNFAIDKQLEKEGIIVRDINSKNILVKQLRNMFKQELLDMAIALDKFFVTQDGLVLRYTKEDVERLKRQGINVKEGDIIWKDGISHNGREIDGAYDNYHHKKGVIVKEEDGVQKLVGNVFHSDKFTVFDENGNEVRNYGDELIYELFNPLYGGFNKNYIQTIRDEAGNIIDIAIPEQKLEDFNAKIDAKLSEYITALVNDAYSRLLQFENIIGEGTLTYQNVAEFVLNYQIAYNNFNDLFEGDSKFYKDAQTFLKRAKEIQGSGVPYGIANFANTFKFGKEVVESPLASKIFLNPDGTRYEIQQFDKFTGVTVVNTVTANQKTLETLVNTLVKNGVSKEQAEKLMEGFGYKNPKKETTVNDAQSYITFDEWIRRITARGQLNKYTPLIQKVLSGEELNGAELSEFIQVQKNFYYDQHFDEKSRIFASRQIKNAEFVLVPQLIKGTQLEVVAKLMKKYGIDQLNTEETSKAGKTNTLSVFDSKTGEVHQDIIDEFEGKGVSKFGQTINEVGRGKQTYSYEFLYTQQETPQHLDAENKAGIQIMKKIIDNITEDDKELYEYKKNFIDLYTANIIESAQKLFKELNLELDKNGNPKIKTNSKGEIVIKDLKYSVFYDKLKAELFRLGYDSNMIDYVTLGAVQADKNGNVTLMPNYMSMVGQKLESIAQSVFNNSITRQKLPGFHAAQITNVGFKATKDQVSYSNELRYHTDKNGKYVDYIEVMLPASAFHFKRRNADGSLKEKGKIEADGKPTPGSLLEELYNANLQDIIGYRIPTEGKQSVCKMRVVGFIDDGYGSTIVVPNEWVAQTGSDFDIDSVYGIQHSTYVDKEGRIRKHEYDKTKSPSDNKRNARNNEILDNMLAILSHPKSLEENLSRSNFEDITDARDAIYDLGGKIGSVAKRRNGRSVYNVIDQADYQEDTMSGAKLKGFSVTRDNFCSVCNTVRPVVSDSYAVWVEYSTDIISYKEAVSRFGQENVQNRGDKIRIKHNKFGWSNDNKNVVGKILTAYSSQTTAHILDAVKEGSIPNVNDFTFGVYKLFPDLGINYDTAVAFIMQNGITRIVNAYNKTKSIYLNDTQKPIANAVRELAKDLGLTVKDWTSIDTILKEINDKYADNIRRLFGIRGFSLKDTEIANWSISSENLKKNLTSPLEGDDAKIYDLYIILQYNKLKHLADEVGNLARVCNPDKFGAKQSIYATNKVFEDINNLIHDKSGNPRIQALTVDDKPFLTAIYPDIDKGIAGYMTSKNNNSKYPILHTFLKYSTAPSVIINRTLFRTQSSEFRTYVLGLEKMLSNGTKLTEAQYKAFEKYLISELYTQADRLVLPITFNKRARKNVWVSPTTENITEEELEEIKEQERARIFGYRTTLEPVMIVEKDGKEVQVPFEIKDIAHPTQTDIDNFAALTPAQKVAFIQENFRDTGIFGQLIVNLFNTRDISGKKAGSQTIEFLEDTISKEDAYIQFTEAFCNRNPLIALAAYDLIKYAFVVEGYKISKRGISKIIPNNVLRGDFDSNGIGLVKELNGNFNKLEENLRFREDDAYVDFVRSHFKSLNIPFKYVTKTGKNTYELKRTNDIILIPNTEENKYLLGKYKITYNTGSEKESKFNSFVRLKFGNDDEVLYRIKSTKKGVALYPLNPLEENEHGKFSSNSANWKFASKEYYETIITDLDENTDAVFDNEGISVIASNYQKQDYKHKSTATKSDKFASKDFDLINPDPNDIGMVDQILEQTSRFYSTKGNTEKPMYMINSGLERHIYLDDRKNGISQVLPIKYHDELGNADTFNLPVIFYKLKASDVYYCIQPYLGSGSNKEIAKKHQKYTAIINILRDAGITVAAKKETIDDKTRFTTIQPIFCIQPRNIITVTSTEEQKPAEGVRRSRLTEGRNATATDVAGDIFKSVNRVIKADTADKDTLKVRQYWRDKSITFDKQSIDDNLFTIIRSGSEYITKRVESIINQLKYFMEDPNGDGYLAVNSPGVIEQIYDNPELRNRLLQLILEAEALVKNNMSILELDIQSQDEKLQGYLNKIKSKLEEIQNSNIIAEAQNLFANEYLKNYSTNPLIKQDLLNVLNGFYSTSWLESWVGDLQETPNSMLQIISKQVTSDIFAKEKLAHQRVRDFEDKLSELVARGADFKHIIDESGRFIQNYDQKLIDDMEELRETARAAREAYNNGEGDFRTYLEAKLKYDKWKLAHINQELDDDYYRRKIALEDKMLHGTTPSKDEIALGADPKGTPGYADIFVKYKELEYKRKELYSHTVNGYLDPYYLEELDKISKEISNLIDDSYINPLTNKREQGREEYDPLFNPLTGTEEEKRIKLMYSGPHQRALQKYIKDMKELNDEYFERTTEFGFEEELNRNIRIISSYEKRDANGNITVPINLLMDNPEYVAAKEWVAHNAKFIMNDENKEELYKAREVLRKKGGRVALNRAIEAHGGKDIYGNVDAREFTEKEIEDIKREQVGDQNYHDSNSFSDRTLIKNGPASTVIYKRDFYAGLNVPGTNNREWFEIVNEINSLLEPYWSPDTKTINFALIPDTEEGIKILEKVGTLYFKLQNTKRKEGASKEEVKKAIKFREENVDDKLSPEDQALFDSDLTLADGKSDRYKRAFRNIAYIVVDKVIDDEIKTEVVPNYYLYGSLHPKAEVADKWIDKEKTEAINLLNKTYTTVPTEYYYQKVDEMRRKGKEAFDKWYYANHVWNPSTRNYDPIRCWTTYVHKDTSSNKGEWVPQWINTRNEVRPERRNKNHIRGVGHAMNYKNGSGYDNSKVSQQNEADKELKTYLQDLLYSLVHTDSGLRYLNKGYLPSQTKSPDTDAKFVGKEFLKALGWVTYHSGKERFHEDIGYDTDKTINMPMLALLAQKELKEVGIKEPVRQENESDEDFAKRMSKYEEDKKALNEENAKAHAAALNQDWAEVIKSFILQASHFNAIQDNKYMLFFGKRMIEKMETYITKYGGMSDFQTDSINSTEENPEYKSHKEDHLLKQYENWIRRLVYDEWKEPRNQLTKWASRLQSLTSAQYMMMNIRGGIANVTLGETQIIAEAFAKQYFGGKSWAKGIGLWNSSIISQMAKMDSDKSITLADAVIKWFNVVDYDENTGKSRIVENPTMKGFNKFNRLMYSPQTIGENFMQNSALFAMLYDHHVYEEEDPVTHKTTVVFKNHDEAIRDADIAALKSVLNDSQKEEFDKIIQDAKADANKLREYAWYKKDFVNEYAKLHLNQEQREAYAKAKKNQIKVEEDKFNKLPNLMDQLKLGSDGYMQIKEDSILAKYNTTSDKNPVSDALKLLADFRGRVISVNKKIHGVYDKMGQAQLEKKWYGSLVMQYHKHIYPGMLKRWRVKGMYNEQRGTIEKGSYISLMQFLATPITKMKYAKSLSEGEINALQSIQNFFKNVLDFCLHIKTYWNILPEYEKANIRRNWGDLIGVTSAMLLAMALRGIDDDDKDESIWYNLALYEADRLASESFQFNPAGMISEAKKLWSTPIAAQSGVEDLISTMGFMVDWLFDEDFDPTYQSGRFAGQNKLVVRLKRRIPIYRGINTSFLEITESNHYYKMGQNMLNSKIVENMIEWVDDEE